MGLKALRCKDAYADVAKACCAGEGRLTASDFSGTDILKGMALTAAMVLAAGCVDKQTNDAGYSEEHDADGDKLADAKTNADGPAAAQQPEQPDLHGKYPFDASAKPDCTKSINSWPCDLDYDNTLTVGNVKGFHSTETGATYWIDFKGISSDEHYTKHYNYDIYRVDQSGAVEKKGIALENFQGAYSMKGFTANYFKEIENPDAHDYLAVIDFEGNKEWPDLKLIAYASLTVRDYPTITNLMIGEANVSTRFVKG